MKILLALAFALGQAQPAPQADKPPDPEEERKTFKVADGFEVTLFAADPLVAKPIQINFDARGRLWVATSSIYPQIGVGEVPNDKIVILEDTDGDGKADKSSVFADGLFIPTAVEPGHGGAYVANSTEVLHLEDTDGDGKADRRRVLLSGFGTEDTHHILHTFRWGPEGDLYFNQSIYIHSNIETPHGPRRLGGAGIWRFRPSTLELEVLCKGMCNPWGHTIDPWGQSFGTDGAGGDGIHFLMPGATYPHFPSGERHFPGLNPGQPKYCAHEILSGRHLPDEVQGHLLANDFRANRVVRFALTDEGAGYSSKQAGDLIKSTDRAFRPVDIRMGPDGAIYIADWYNPIINHGEVGFRDPRRDRTHGRIWRVTAKGRPLVQRPKLAGAPVTELLEQLKSPEDWTRHFAKRVLSEKDPKEVLPALAAWTKAQTDEHAKLEALWMHQAFDVAEPDLLRALLRSPDFRARAAATRLLARRPRWVPDPLGLLETQVADEHPRVRLEAVRALREMPSERAVEIAMRALDKPTDRFLDYVLWLTAYELKSVWLPAFEAGRVTFGANRKHADFALQAVKSPMALKTQIERIKAEGWMADEARAAALSMVTAFGTADDLRTLFAASYEPGLQAKVLGALARAARERDVKPAGDLSGLRRHIGHADAGVRSAALGLAGAWKLDAFRPDLAKAAGAGDKAAVEGLAALGGEESLRFFRGMTASAEPRARQLGVIGLAAIDLKEAAGLAGGSLAGDPTELFAAFLQKKGGAEALAAALDPKKVPPDAAKLGLRWMYGAGRQEPALVAILNAAMGLTTKGRELAPEAMRELMAQVASKGDAVRGEQVFRRKDLSCLQCHAVGGAGGAVGPDFISLGASAPVDYLVESILTPDKKQKEGYVSMAVMTKAGDVVTGVRVRESGEELVLRDAIRDEIVIPKVSIEASKITGSVMPSGLADLMTDAELLDLVRFLSELGRAGPYAVTAAPVVRRWRALEGEAWVPAYSQVSGVLPVEKPTQLRAEVEVTTPGRFRLRLNSAKGLELTVDGKPVDAKDEVELELARGLHVLGFKAEPRAEGLRCEFEEAPGSPGRGRAVGGK